jgi:AraC family L-rhamnose operon regulatory protein RhaS
MHRHLPTAKTANNRAIYRAAGKRFVADSCRSLVEAAAAGQVRLRAFGRAGYPGQRLPAAELPGLCSVGSWDAPVPQNWGLPLHRNEGIEISFLASGKMAARIEDRLQTLSHDEFLVTRPWQPHQLGHPHVGASRLIWLILDVGVRRPHQEWHWPEWLVLSRADLAELTRCLRQNEQFIWPGSPDIRRCFLGLARAIESEKFGDSASRLAVLINEILLAVLDLFRSRRIPLRAALTSTERTLQQFIDELTKTLGEPWTLATMAASCHMGVTQFVQHFRQATNLTPARYLMQARIRRAGQMLVDNPARPITDIAYDCGFSSSQYFTNVFARQMGCSPRQFRRQQTLARPATRGITPRPQKRRGATICSPT